MSKAGPSFQYSPLKSGEIRLLNPRLDDSGNLTWELNSVPLLNNEGTGKPIAPSDYDALSYTWGNPEDQTFPITCNNQTIMVCKNLYDALPYIPVPGEAPQAGRLPTTPDLDRYRLYKPVGQTREDGTNRPHGRYLPNRKRGRRVART